ncbi:hypothetical protein FGB62_140g038 [Gracilaria domingensis]|nr:hypothetical protein FGB62_140g038 [Gracilaria domingensis]
MMATVCVFAASKVSVDSEKISVGHLEKLQGFACRLCPKGSVCVGHRGEKRCVIPKRAGERCGSDPDKVCQKGLTCVNHMCTPSHVKLGMRCAKGGATCEPGAVCAGPAERKMCVKPIDAGLFCGQNLYQVCEADLECIKGICLKKVPAGGNCLTHGSICAAGTVCAGTFNRKVCVIPQSEGHRCGRTLFQVCQQDLTCVQGRCISSGGFAGFRAGGRGARGAGMRCGNRLKCDKWLRCQKGICRIRRKRSCSLNRNACVLGTVCAGPPHILRCVRPKTAGKRCQGNPYRVCARGLTCQNGMCRGPAGSPCKKNKMCIQGAVCVGRKGNKRCSAPHLADSSPIPRYRGPIPWGGNCKAPGSVCLAGLVCAGTEFQKRCVIPMPLDHPCGQDPFWVCQNGLACVNGRCTAPSPETPAGPEARRAGGVGGRCKKGRKCAKWLRCQEGICRIPRKRACSSSRTACVLGTVCAGPPHKLRCVRPMSAGKRCGHDPYLICSRGLKCIDHICRKEW